MLDCRSGMRLTLPREQGEGVLPPKRAVCTCSHQGPCAIGSGRARVGDRWRTAFCSVASTACLPGLAVTRGASAPWARISALHITGTWRQNTRAPLLQRSVPRQPLRRMLRPRSRPWAPSSALEAARNSRSCLPAACVEDRLAGCVVGRVAHASFCATHAARAPPGLKFASSRTESFEPSRSTTCSLHRRA